MLSVNGKKCIGILRVYLIPGFPILVFQPRA